MDQKYCYYLFSPLSWYHKLAQDWISKLQVDSTGVRMNQENVLDFSCTFCSYLLWVQVDERRARIVYPVEKNLDAAGIEPVTSR